MNIQELTRELRKPTDSKIVLVVADGLGGLPMNAEGPTELEVATTPHLDELARGGTAGLAHPISPGISCGSGPGHLALFGYDPLVQRVGRGVLSALGIDFELQDGDVAARGNFCLVDDDRKVVDRRAGRIPDHEGQRLVERLRQIALDDAQVFVRHVKQYRSTVVFRGKKLGDDLNDSGPRSTRVEPRKVKAGSEASKKTEKAVKKFLEQAAQILHADEVANMVLLRGFASKPEVPPMSEVYGVSACAIAIYPMYRGLSRLLGMRVPLAVTTLADPISQLESHWSEHDYFFLHHKDTDSLGEDGDFEGKVHTIEQLDTKLRQIVERQPDVLVVTGDHSTPSRLKNHSWHPVPVLLSAKTCRPDLTTRFAEREATNGGLGQFAAKHLMPLALGHAEKLDKFGA